MSVYVPPHKRNRPQQEQQPQTNNQSPRSGYSNSDRQQKSNYSGGLQTRNSRWASDSNDYNSPRSYGKQRRDPRDSYVDGLLPRNTDIERDLFKGAKQKNEGLDFTAYDDIPVETEGVDLPEPLEKFSDIDIGPVVLNALDLSGFSVPTPIQKHALPIILEGHDLMACAQTGSGKTAAFLLPMISYLLKHMDEYDPFRHRGYARPAVLVLAPTRELADQIYKASKKFSYRSHLRTVCVYGGSSFGRQADQVRRGCDILVATPGRLIDMLNKGLISMEEIKFLSIDEADRMLDMGFEDQMKEIIFDHGMPTTDSRQTLMFSATFPVPIQRLAEDFLSDYAFVQVGELGISTHLVTQRVQFVEERDKYEVLKEVLNEIPGRTLVFTATKVAANDLDDFLYRDGFSSQVIHGDRSQYERMQALNNFKSGKCRVLVATDVASRGIHVEGIQHVINFDLPSNIQDYVHRIGRTGRCGQEGYATAFFNYDNLNVCRDLVEALKDAGQETPSWLLEIASKNRGRGKKGKGGRNQRGNGGGYGYNKGGYGGGGYGYNNRGNSYGNSYQGNSYGNTRNNYNDWDNRNY